MNLIGYITVTHQCTSGVISEGEFKRIPFTLKFHPHNQAVEVNHGKNLSTTVDNDPDISIIFIVTSTNCESNVTKTLANYYSYASVHSKFEPDVT